MIAPLQVSQVWDTRFDLPLFPALNNPFIYGAYVWHLFGQPKDMQFRFSMHASTCYEPLGGKLYRWPDKSGGSFSHDEIIGLAAISPRWAEKLLIDLLRNDGEIDDDETQRRFIFLEPYLRARSPKWKCGKYSQTLYALHLVVSCLKWNHESSGPLKIWLMNHAMVKYKICGWAILFYNLVMLLRGVDERWIFKEHFHAYPQVWELLVTHKGNK